MLFDLGGVLRELAPLKTLGRFFAETDEDAVWRRWLARPRVLRFERGDCDSRHRFLSRALGLVKPDRARSDHVLTRLGCAASSVAFLDDKPIHVAGARSAGLRAERVRVVDQARAALAHHGLHPG